MSRRKRNKIKTIIKKDHIVKTVLSVIFGILIIVLIGFYLFCSVSNTWAGLIVKSDEQIKQIVDITNEYWNKPSELYEKVNERTYYNTFITDLCFVDDNLYLRYGDASELPDFSDYDFSKESPARILEETGKFKYNRIEAVPLWQDFSPSNFVRTYIFWNIGKNDELLTWAAEQVPLFSQWIIYKTDIEDVNVCVKYLYIFNKIDLAHIVLLVLIAITSALFINLLVVLLIISIIRRSVFTNKIIYTDPVTGEYNRDYFIDIALRKARKNTPYAVIQFRLEKYRNYCTAYGLKQGEILLEKIDEKGNKFLQRREKIAHIEKADFAMLLKYTDKNQLEERLKTMAAGFNQEHKDQHMNFAAGICPVQSKKDDMSMLLNSAGLALSKAENQNSHLVWFNEEMNEEQLWERRVEEDMENGILNHEFQVYLQPKYSTKKEKLEAAEALVRWIHPELGFISPGKFIPLFETNGFILQLDDYMLREIAKLQAQWLSEGKKLVPISVNISRAHFSMDNLAEHICSIVDEYKVPHEFIELELTESAFFDDKTTLLETVKQLKKFGFKISMDDFGAGYSSLNSLKELPLDIIKLDAEFFRGIDDINRANAIVSDTIALAKKLGMEIVAEGIETREQVDFLAKQNCDLIQGFYFAKPLPVDEFIEKAYGEKK